MNWPLLQNSLLVSGLATLVAVGAGFVFALGAACLSPRLRRGWVLAGVLVLVLPPFLVTNCWLDLFGANGSWRGWCSFNVYSPAGAVVLLALLTWPVTSLLALAAWSSLEAAHLESDPALRGWAVVRWVLWPMARAAVGQGALLSFVLALNNFTVPVILQVQVFPEELWLAFTARLNDAGAWAAAVPLIVAPFLLLLCLRRAPISWPRVDGAVPAGVLRRQLGRGWVGIGVAGSALLLLVSLALPVQQLAFSARTWLEIPNLFRAAPGVIWNSIALPAVVATGCVTASLACRRLPIGPLLWLMFLVPGILLGRALISAFAGTLLHGTASLVILAFSVRYLAVSFSGVSRAMAEVDQDLVDAARLEGASGWQLLSRVYWPQIAAPVGAAWYVTYLLCLWDVETLVLIYPPGGETLALRIFNLLHYGHNAQVNALCLVLLAVAAAPLLAWQAWQVLQVSHWMAGDRRRG